MPTALLLLVVLSHLGSEHIAAWSGWSIKAVEYVAYGIETSVLWGAVSSLFCSLSRHEAAMRLWAFAVQSICAYGMFESLQRASCRLMFPMHMAPIMLNPEKGLCASVGIPTFYLSPYGVALLILVFGGALEKASKG